VSGVARLADALRAEGGLLADALLADAADVADEPLLADVPDGPYALTLAAVREGYLLHYGASRLLDATDRDLALLGGDRLYALALAELARLGDLAAVARLADLISQCAQAHAEDDPARSTEAWRVTASAHAR
jgi:hypothetical protein